MRGGVRRTASLLRARGADASSGRRRRSLLAKRLSRPLQHPAVDLLDIWQQPPLVELLCRIPPSLALASDGSPRPWPQRLRACNPRRRAPHARLVRERPVLGRDCHHALPAARGAASVDCRSNAWTQRRRAGATKRKPSRAPSLPLPRPHLPPPPHVRLQVPSPPRVPRVPNLRPVAEPHPRVHVPHPPVERRKGLLQRLLPRLRLASREEVAVVRHEADPRGLPPARGAGRAAQGARALAFTAPSGDACFSA